MPDLRPPSAKIEVTQRPDGAWWLVFAGPVTGNGSGDKISADRAKAIIEAFGEPLTHARIGGAGFYDDAAGARRRTARVTGT